MSQRFEKLKTAIAEVKQELSSATTLDDATRHALEGALEEALKQANQDPQAESGLQEGADQFEPESLIERLQATEENFQVSHPTLSGVVLRMIDALAQLGI